MALTTASIAGKASFQGLKSQSKSFIVGCCRPSWTAAPASLPRPINGLTQSRHLAIAGAVAAGEAKSQETSAKIGEVRVRFAPSPTGNLHVGGARTALFNWLYARKTGGKFILRIEDTDVARSTRESEEAVLRDLKWLGLDWDEGPDCGGPYGPYRQSERTAIYMEMVNKLVNAGMAFPCFCTDEEIDQMKADAEAQGLPPVYRGKWKTATQAEVDAELAKGTKPVYRFRVPENEDVTIVDQVRGEVTWNTSTVGDFVIMRSNGLPVYNFCVTVDDALMKITHVLRAEEHLPNTLRQVLLYRALGFKEPNFAHVSIILAPDRSKLSKRHGATSVGQFAEMGYLPEAMINYLALLGWNDGTEQELFTVPELQDRFTIERITKSAAVFDKDKLNWMNGQILRNMDDASLVAAVGRRLVEQGLTSTAEGPWIETFALMSRKSLEVLADVEREFLAVLSYPLSETMASDGGKELVEDGFRDIALAMVAQHEAGTLEAAAKDKSFKSVINAVGKEHERKGKRLFMPIRVAMTGAMHGPDIPEQMWLLANAEGVLTEAALEKAVPLATRMAELKKWLSA